MTEPTIYHLIDKNGASLLFIPRCILNDSRVQEFKTGTESKVIMCDTASITDYGFFYEDYHEWNGTTSKTYVQFSHIRRIEQITFNKQENKHD